MSNYVIIPDSSCDLPAHLRQRFGITDYLHGVLYYPDGHAEPCDLDWNNISPEDFYDSMKKRNVLYKTATPPMEDTERIFEKYLSQGMDVLSISLSSALSSSYQNVLLVARDLRKKYPERKILCVDSLRYSNALALLTILACNKREEGLSIEENAAWLEETRHCIHQMGPMDDLFFLVKTGRISNAKAFFGSLVGVNPMADFNRKGLSEVLVKMKGKRAAFDATLKYMEQTVIDPAQQIIFIAHSNRAAAAEQLAELVREKFSPREIIINHVGQACGASVGPGLVAVYYVGQPISEDLNKEKEIMAEISAAQKKK
ncbi:MAG: DegV family EDD domain-containing protein [Oscillospiraceae bacterium]|nr:DegV family EDD domain-containing protein [Oscillospiraceae bacterium]